MPRSPGSVPPKLDLLALPEDEQEEIVRHWGTHTTKWLMSWLEIKYGKKPSRPMLSNMVDKYYQRKLQRGH